MALPLRLPGGDNIDSGDTATAARFASAAAAAAKLIVSSSIAAMVLVSATVLTVMVLPVPPANLLRAAA